MDHPVVYQMPGGLKEKIPAGKKVIADSAYRKSKDVVTTRNPRDDPDVRRLKTRARMRHEGFNGRLKTFKSISGKFRHGLGKHKEVFEAVCVIAQYQMENGSPLYDV